jgi:ribosomal protein L29
MDLHKLSTEELRGFEPGKLKETESEIRRALVTIKMDIYTAKNQHTAKIRGLKKALARLLTVQHQVSAKAPAAKAPKAAKPVAAAKPKAAKAPAKAKAAAKPEKAKPTTKKAKS